MLPANTNSNGTIKILDDYGISLARYTITNGLVAGTGIGGGTTSCFFDAPTGITTTGFYVSVFLDVDLVELSIFMEET